MSNSSLSVGQVVRYESNNVVAARQMPLEMLSLEDYWRASQTVNTGDGNSKKQDKRSGPFDDHSMYSSVSKNIEKEAKTMAISSDQEGINEEEAKAALVKVLTDNMMLQLFKTFQENPNQVWQEDDD